MEGGVGEAGLVVGRDQKLPALGTGTVHLQAIHRPLPTPHYTYTPHTRWIALCIWCWKLYYSTGE